MSNNFHFGDEVTQHGNYNIGMIKASAGPRASFEELLTAVQLLRGQVSGDDQEVIDESLRDLGTGQGVPRGTMRRALANISDVATMVGTAGVPVIEAVRKLTGALAL